MANIRSLKKDIDFLMSLVLEDCLYILNHHPEADPEKVRGIISHVILNHSDLREKVTHGQVRTRKENLKKYLSEVVEEMYAKADDSLDELAALVRK
jgi:hypothetical protein